MYADIMTLCLGYLCSGRCNISRTALHWTPLGDDEARATQEHLVSNCRRGAQDLQSDLGDQSKAQAQNRQEWGAFVAALHASRNNGHE